MDRLLSMRVFQCVVDEGGFAAAARALDLSSAAVTRLVADLEAYLGVRLLHRTTRRLSVTDAGEAYLSRVRTILLDIDEADAQTKSHTQDLAGTLRIHAPPVLASYVLAPLLADFRRLHPTVVFDIEVEALLAPPIEEHDITLVGTDTVLGADVIARKVLESQSILVASPDYIQRSGMPKSPNDLTNHACLRLKLPGNSRQLTWPMWPEQTPEEVIEPRVTPVLLANHTDTLLRAALDGAGITSVSLDLVAPYLTKGELVRVLSPWITGRLIMYAALPSRKFIPQRTRIFLDFLLERARQQSMMALQACAMC